MHDSTFPTYPPRLNTVPKVRRPMQDRNSVRVYRASPEDVTLQLRMEAAYVSVTLTFEQARDIGTALQLATKPQS